LDDTGTWRGEQARALCGTRHGLQGPIDDAFMERFVMVKATGKPINEKVGAWIAAEQAHAMDH
jgi:hypothetical protein